MKEKLLHLMQALNKGLVEREEIITISLLTMLAQENLILIGPPGTAKSEISRRLSQVFINSNYFEYLFTKFTTPEEVFGPLSIKKLKEDRFERNTAGYMPTSEIVFLDEIFKANSSILNSLLTIINEKNFHNGSVKEKAPLISLVGASNELPVDDEELSALYDRFLVRNVVGYVKDENVHKLFNVDLDSFKIDESMKLTLEELEIIRTESKKVVVTDAIKNKIIDIRLKFNEEFKENASESISDRRLVKVIKFLKTAAYTNGRNEINESDLLLLRYCLWNNPENMLKVNDIIKTAIAGADITAKQQEKEDLELKISKLEKNVSSRSATGNFFESITASAIYAPGGSGARSKPADPQKLKELNTLKLKVEAELEELQKQKKLLFSQIQANIWLRDNKQ